jgi:hypothetical protein
MVADQMLPMERYDMNKNSSIRPRPTKLSGGAMIVAGAAFLLFSIVPFSAAEGEAKPFAAIFGVIWVLVCLSFIIYGIYILNSKKPSIGIVYDIEVPAARDNPVATGDFETRIRKLEKLKDDRLITEEEYKTKRSEIMKEPW